MVSGSGDREETSAQDWSRAITGAAWLAAKRESEKRLL
jgi:hypothetical protein